METKLVVALHGFLGLPEDWEAWHQGRCPDAELLALDLWRHPELNSTLSLSEWTNAFISWAQGLRASYGSIELWGYSMGGRLALGALVMAPSLFTRTVICSANPGLQDPRERLSRKERDSVWSKKFREQEWPSLMQEWHQQPVLQEPTTVDKSVHRQEKDFNRERLALAMENWSIAEQPSYWESIQTLNLPMEWHVGAFDHVYLDIGEKLALSNSHIQLHIHANRGHRVIL
jgi:2-succinyl-6-hydroxy-2,4-cyclohexadiene-1-carboxylate synthase